MTRMIWWRERATVSAEKPVETTASIHPSAELFQPIIMVKPGMIIIGEKSRIDSFVKLEGGQGLEIGRYVHVASFAHIGIGGGETTLEDYSAVASGGKIISGSNQIYAVSMSAIAPPDMQRVKTFKTVLRRFAVVLTNAVVLPGIILGEGAVLAAGAVATRDIPDWQIWSGVPAKFLMIRPHDQEMVK